jgi:Leucine-rich repeat (LRR) protein
LDFSRNKLISTIPNDIGVFTNLQILDFWENYLTGTIPSSVGNLSEIKYLDTSGNNIRGTVPESIGTLSKLTNLDMSVAQLSGTLPESIALLPNLVQIFVQKNFLSGNILDIVSPKLLLADFSSNKFTGALPKLTFTVAKNLSIFSANDNCLDNELPEVICASKKLQNLFLSGIGEGTRYI